MLCRVATGTSHAGKIMNGSLNTVVVDGNSCALLAWGNIQHLQAAQLEAGTFGGGASDG